MRAISQPHFNNGSRQSHGGMEPSVSTASCHHHLSVIIIVTFYHQQLKEFAILIRNLFIFSYLSLPARLAWKESSMKHCRWAKQLRLTSDICGWLPGQNQHSSALQCSDPWCNAMLVWTAVQCCKLSASWSSWPRRDPRMLLSALEPFPLDQSLRSFSQNQSFLWDTIIAIISYWSIISFRQFFWIGKICQSLLGTFLPEKNFFKREGMGGSKRVKQNMVVI